MLFKDRDESPADGGTKMDPTLVGWLFHKSGARLN